MSASFRPNGIQWHSRNGTQAAVLISPEDLPETVAAAIVGLLTVLRGDHRWNIYRS